MVVVPVLGDLALLKAVHSPSGRFPKPHPVSPVWAEKEGGVLFIT